VSPRRRALIAAFALLGLGASSYSTYVHHNLLTDPAYASACDVTATVSCSQAYESRYGSFLGVPVALEGMIYFVVVLILAGIAGRPASTAREHAASYIFALATVGLGFTLYLAWALYFVLHVFCILCAISYVSVIAIFIVSGGGTTTAMTTLPRRALRDLRSLVTSPMALIVALVLIGGSAAAIAVFPKEVPPGAEEQAGIPPLTSQQRADLEVWWKVQPKVDLPIPMGPGVKVQIVTFSDYQCPACRAAHDTLGRVVPKYDRSIVEFVLKHFPLEGECNPFVPGGSHTAACEAAAAYVMARGTGFQQKLDDWLFANQTTLTRDVVRKAAQDIAGISDFDARYAGALKEVRTDANLGGQLNVQSTPTVYLNGRMIAGGKDQGLPPAQYIDGLIEIELKRAK